MNTNHTPGPWKVISIDWTPSGNARFEIEGIHRTGIADARLIAAAPELLEALQAILENDGGEGSKCFNAIRLFDAREEARAAIAKATGEQQ